MTGIFFSGIMFRSTSKWQENSILEGVWTSNIFKEFWKTLEQQLWRRWGKFADDTLNEWIFFQKPCLYSNSKWQENSNLEGVKTSNFFKESWKILKWRLWRRWGKFEDYTLNDWIIFFSETLLGFKL